MKSNILMSTKILLLLCFVTLVNGQTNCRTTAWWVLQPFSKSILQSFINDSKEALVFNSSNPLANFMANDQHPVYFEFNQQNQCQESSLPSVVANATQQTFVEFKLEIPYLIRKNKTVMLKPLIYQNNLEDVGATRLVYGLPTFFADMKADFENNKYSISYKQESLEVSFQPLLPTLMAFGSSETANFSSFVDANVSPWLAFPPWPTFPKVLFPHYTKCASNIYAFSQTAHIRPVTMTLNITGDLLQYIPHGIYTNAGNQPLGAWQIDVHTNITSTCKCP